MSSTTQSRTPTRQQPQQYSISELPDASSSNTQSANHPHASSSSNTQRGSHTGSASPLPVLAILNTDRPHGVSPSSTSSNTQRELPTHTASPLPVAILNADCPPAQRLSSSSSNTQLTNRLTQVPAILYPHRPSNASSSSITQQRG